VSCYKFSRKVHLHIAVTVKLLRTEKLDFIPLDLWHPNSPEVKQVDY